MLLIKSFWGRRTAGPSRCCPEPVMAKSVGRFCRDFLFPDQLLGKREELFAIPAAAQAEKAFHQPETDGRHLIGIQQVKPWRHLDAIHF